MSRASPPQRPAIDLRLGTRGASLPPAGAGDRTVVGQAPRSGWIRRLVRASLLLLVGALALAAGASAGVALYWEDLTSLGVRAALLRLGPDAPEVRVKAVQLRGLHGVTLEDLRVAAPRPIPGRAPLLRLRVEQAEVRGPATDWLRGRPSLDAVDLLAPSLQLDLRAGPRELVAQLRRLRRSGRGLPAPGQSPATAPQPGRRPWPTLRVRQGRVDLLGAPYGLQDVVLEADPQGSDLSFRGGFRPVGLQGGRCTLTGTVGANLGTVTAEVQCSPALQLQHGAVILRADRLRLSHGGPTEPSPIPEAERERLGLVAQGQPGEAGWVVDLPGLEVIAPVPGDPVPRVRLNGSARVVLGAERRLGVQARLTTEAGGRVLLAGVVRLRERRAALDLLVKDMDLARSPVAALLPGNLEAGRLWADVAVDLGGRGRRVDVIGKVEARGLRYQHDRLARLPLEVDWAGADLDVELDLAERRAESFGTRLVVNNLPVLVDGVIDLGHSEPRLHLSAETGRIKAADLRRSVPDALLDRLRGLRVEGSAAFGAKLQLDLALPEELELDVRVDTRRLKLLRVGNAVRPGMLRRPFLHVWEDQERQELYRLETGPGGAAWTPLADLPAPFLRAVLAQEDGGFYRHRGFSMLHVKGSLVRNIRERRFARGASTITMQLARNLFLGRAKRISRKLQEVVIAWALEQELSKDELLALYLNVIEWGPGVFGVGHAARHYFGKQPAELSLRECVFLSTAIPRPRPVHRAFLKGRVLRTQRRRIERMLRLLVRRGHVDPLEADEARAQELSFADPAGAPPLRNEWKAGRRPRRGRHQVRPSERPPEGPPAPGEPGGTSVPPEPSPP